MEFVIDATPLLFALEKLQFVQFVALKLIAHD